MFCKKCGAKLEEQDTFCYFCGATVEKSTETVDKDNFYKETSIDTENLLKVYVGPNEEKIKEGKFSLPTFFLGPWYLLYRKRFLAAILWIAANIIATVIIPEYSWILSIVANVIFAVKFNEFYLETARNKIEKIKEDNQDKSSDELMKIVKAKGGISIAPIILIIIFFTIGLICFALFSAVLSIGTEFEEIFEEVEEKVEEKVPSATKDIYFDYKIPEKFEVGTESSFYRRYSHYGTDASCSIKFQNSSTTIYDSIEDYLNSYIYTSGNDKRSEITQKDINGETWIYQTVETKYSMRYYYSIKTQNRYHLITFEQNRDENGYCSKSHDEFIKSLKLKVNTSNKNDL